MRKSVLALILMSALALPASAQRINLDFPGLADRAEEVVDVTLDATMLRLAAKFLSDGKDDREIKEMINGLQGIYVRSYIMADVQGDRINGLVIIAAEPREFTVVNIVGYIDVERLSRLEGEFGIPRFSSKDGKDE
jgi:hypothetical protein